MEGGSVFSSIWRRSHPHRHAGIHGKAFCCPPDRRAARYVGYEEGGYLREAVCRKPYSVILLEEVEKAHPDVFNVLLQVLDDCRMTDGQGRTVDFKNTMVVMTSNLGSQMIQQMAGDDYQVIKLAVMGEVKTFFRPKFINRIHEAVVFHTLDEKNIRFIARIQLQYLEARLTKLEMKLEVMDTALDEISRSGFDPVFGPHPLKRSARYSHRSRIRWRRKYSKAALAQGHHYGGQQEWRDNVR
jgi:ATP-dependent Clp protease ATP-binding subunit ClpA